MSISIKVQIFQNQELVHELLMPVKYGINKHNTSFEDNNIVDVEHNMVLSGYEINLDIKSMKKKSVWAFLRNRPTKSRPPIDK